MLLTATGVQAVSVDTRRARLGFARSPLTVDVNTDSPLVLHLGGLTPARGLLRLDGRPGGRVHTLHGTLALRVPRGRHRLVIQPRA